MKFDEYEKFQKSGAIKSGSGTTKGTSVRYLTLADDGDEAIVRFAYDSASEFEVFSYHPVKSGDRKIKVLCLRSPLDPVDNCPLCAAEEKISTHFFVKVIHYTKDESGKIVATPKVWQRPVSFCKTLRSYFETYGSLKDCLFKVTRHGKKGDKDTTYDVIYAPEKIYKPEVYIPDFSGFDGYSLVGKGGVIKNKTYEQMEAFLETGEFPSPVTNKTTVDDEIEEPEYDAPIDVQPVEEVIKETPRTTNPYVSTAYGTRTSVTPTRTTTNTTQTTEGPARPRRYPI